MSKNKNNDYYDMLWLYTIILLLIIVFGGLYYIKHNNGSPTKQKNIKYITILFIIAFYARAMTTYINYNSLLLQFGIIILMAIIILIYYNSNKQESKQDSKQHNHIVIIIVLFLMILTEFIHCRYDMTTYCIFYKTSKNK